MLLPYLNMANDTPIYRKQTRINGFGQLVEVIVSRFIPESALSFQNINYNFSPFNGRRYGIPDMNCYSCHHVLNVAGNAECSAHGIRKREKVLTEYSVLDKIL